MLVGEPENHNPLYDHGKTTFSLWEIDTDAMRKKTGRIYLSVKSLKFTTHIVASTDLSLNLALNKAFKII